MTRLNILVEGQTEERFANQLLVPHLVAFNVFACARCLITRRDWSRGLAFRGGIRQYAKVSSDLRRWLREDGGTDARFTTMFDLYGLPADFPGFAAAMARLDPYERVRVLEEHLAADIRDRRFIPYIQLHEYEALLLSQPSAFGTQFFEHTRAIQRLEALLQQYINAELIDGGAQTAPSKRIAALIPEFASQKASVGPNIAGHIGLQTLRSNCPHFGAWLSGLEAL